MSSEHVMNTRSTMALWVKSVPISSKCYKITDHIIGTKSTKKNFNSFLFLGKRLWRSIQPVVGHVGKPGIIFAALENDYIYSGMAQKLKICW